MELGFQEVHTAILVPGAYNNLPAARQLAGAVRSVARRDSGSYAVDCKFEERVANRIPVYQSCRRPVGKTIRLLDRKTVRLLEYFSFPKILEEVVDIDNLNARRCAVDSVVRNKHQLAVGMFFLKCIQPF